MDTKIASIVKALAHTENGDSLNFSNPSVGKTGELKSIFQFEPGTWKAYSKEVSGQDNLPLSPENEAKVVYSKVQNWKKNGYSDDQIASMWNAGAGEPNAYTGKFSDGKSSQGINSKYGVKYDVPGYVNKFNSYMNKINGSTQNIQSNNYPNRGTESYTRQQGLISLKGLPKKSSNSNDRLISLNSQPQQV